MPGSDCRTLLSVVKKHVPDADLVEWDESGHASEMNARRASSYMADERCPLQSTPSIVRLHGS